MSTYAPTTRALAKLLTTFGSASFTGAQSRLVGIDRRQLLYLAERGMITRLHRDTYCLDPAEAVRAATNEACTFAKQHGVTPIIGGAVAASVWDMETASARSLIWVPIGSPVRRGNRGGAIIREGRIDDEC